jgi:site-specific recombinase XerD
VANPANHNATLMTAADCDSTLLYLAHDAGISRPNEINAEALRHTYFAYLARQGIRVSELRRLDGSLTPAILAAYARLAPPGVGRPLEEINSVYPALLV